MFYVVHHIDKWHFLLFVFGLQVGSAWWSDPIFYLDCKMGAKLYLLSKIMKNGGLVFTPNYENWGLKSQKFPNFQKGEKKGGCLNSTIKKQNKKQGVKFDSRLKGWGSIPRNLPTNFTYAVPPPPGVIKCLSYSAESVSKMYQLSRVSSCHLWDYICPTDQFNFDGREDISVFQTGISELSHFKYYLY